MEAFSKPVQAEDWAPPLVLVIGMGMGPDDLSAAALRWIGRAEVLFGGKRHLESFSNHSGSKMPLGRSLDESLAELEAVSRMKRTVVLASGDPLYYGIGRRLIQVLGRDRIHVVPNVTTVQALFARIRAPWDDIGVFSLHGRQGEGPENDWMSAVRQGATVALFTDHRHTPAWVGERLVSEGLNGCRMIVGEDLGLDTEAVRRLLPDEALRCSFSPLNLCVVLPDEECAAGGERAGMAPPHSERAHALVFGLEESAFAHEAGLITKLEVRAVVLAHLHLRDGLVLWDIGAGSGSVSIEASRVAAFKRIVALEKGMDRYRQLVENVRKLGHGPIETVRGNAADLLADLPQPDRVFIGGSGGDLRRILEQVAERIRPGGRVVQTAVTLDTLEEMRSFWGERGWLHDLVQIQINRSVPIGPSHRFEALNPVFLITAVHPRDESREWT